MAAHAWLAARPEVDASDIAVAGHSAGALVACRLCGAVPALAGAALLGALVSPIEDMLAANARRVREGWDGLTGDQRDWLARELPAQLVRAEATAEILAAARNGDGEVTVEGHGISLTVPLARLRQDLERARPVRAGTGGTSTRRCGGGGSGP